MQRVLLDTCIWVKVFRKEQGVTQPALKLFRSGMAVVHPWTITELLLGTGVPAAYLRALHGAPQFLPEPDGVLMPFVQEHALQRCGIGLVDLQILATAHRHGVALWTTDAALDRATLAVGLPRPEPDRW